MSAVEDERAIAEREFSALMPEVGRELEYALFNWSIAEAQGTSPLPTWDHEAVRAIYRNKLRMLLWNLQDERVTLLGDLKAKRIRPTEACYLSHADLRPDLWDFPPPHGQLETDEPDPAVETAQSELKCRECARRGLPAYRTEFREFQTRSSDESTTLFCYCHNCHARWRFSG
jgi:DNA-directed RNA polymerase subunit M/transcription elongation factor TFIIS